MNSLEDALTAFNRAYHFDYPLKISGEPPAVPEVPEVLEKEEEPAESKEKEVVPDKVIGKEHGDIPEGQRVFISGRYVDEPMVQIVGNYLGLSADDKLGEQKYLGELVEFAANKIRSTDPEKIFKFIRQQLRHIGGLTKNPHRQLLAKLKIEQA